MINDATYKRSIIDIVGDVVNAMPNPPVVNVYKVTKILSYAGPGNAWELNVDDFYYATIGYTVSIGGNSYTVIALDDTVGNFILSVSDPTGKLPDPVKGVFNLYPFYYFHGTPIDTADEIKNIKQASNKWPMIWLMEPMKEKFHHDPADAVERVTPVRLFFLDQRNPKAGPTDLLWQNYIKPMCKFRDLFVEYLKTQYQDYDYWDMVTEDTYYAKFGVYINGKGIKESLFVDNLAGVEMDIPLKIKKPPVDFRHCSFD